MLDIAAIDFCAVHHTDGEITEAQLKTLLAFGGIYHESEDTLPGIPTPVVAETLIWRLVHARRLDQIGPGLFSVHDFAEYQLTRAELEHRRQRDAERQRRRRQKRHARVTVRQQRDPPACNTPLSSSGSSVSDSSAEGSVQSALNVNHEPAKGSLAFFVASLTDASERTFPAVVSVVQKWRLPEAALWAALEEARGPAVRSQAAVFVAKLNEYGEERRYAA